MRAMALTLLLCLAFTSGFLVGAVMGYRLCNANWTAALEKLAGEGF